MINMKSSCLLKFSCLFCISFSHVMHAAPVPEPGINNHVVHSLATYATTNSFLYTNKIGTLNYRFTKPQLSRAQTFTKLVGLPFQPSLFSTSGHLYTSDNPSQASVDATSQNLITNGQTNIISNEVSPFLVPPEPGTQFTPFLKGIVAKNDVVQQKDLSIQNDFSLDNSKIAGENLKSDSIPENDNFDSIIRNETTYTDNFPGTTAAEKSDAKTPEDSKSELEKLFNQVINAPFHRTATSAADTHDFSNAQQVDTKTAETPSQSRQDSNIEHPTSFFPSGADNISPPQMFHTQPGPRPQFPSLLSGNHRFAVPSRPNQASGQPNPFSQLPQFQQPGLFPGNNRFSTQQNLAPHPQLSTLNNNPHSQLMSQFRPGSNNAFPAAGQPHLQYPGFNNPSPGAPPPEPENGFNPFHLQEQFPEPPYESEFASDTPEEGDSLEQHQRSAGNSDIIASSQVLDFAQSTLRNVQTEELLGVIRRKPVPPECAYNTISYGVNGEDCVEARKK